MVPYENEMCAHVVWIDEYFECRKSKMHPTVLHTQLTIAHRRTHAGHPHAHASSAPTAPRPTQSRTPPSTALTALRMPKGSKGGDTTPASTTVSVIIGAALFGPGVQIDYTWSVGSNVSRTS